MWHTNIPFKILDQRQKQLSAEHQKEHVNPFIFSVTNAPVTLQARQNLLVWYDANHRILPWRRNSSSQRPLDGTEGGGAPAELPQQQFIYFVWVSEVMSQQTQVR